MHMGYSINLRGDLAKLSDAQLAERLNEACHAYDTASQKPKETGLMWLLFWWSRRGPIRHPRAYRFLAVFANSYANPPWLHLALAWVLSGKKAAWLVGGSRVWDTHLAVCEIRDIEDEIKRRLANRRRTES